MEGIILEAGKVLVDFGCTFSCASRINGLAGEGRKSIPAPQFPDRGWIPEFFAAKRKPQQKSEAKASLSIVRLSSRRLG
jgi:hypothetical protein